MGVAVLITGTDTEVGKTYVACGILKALRNMGIGAVPFKPVETGCSSHPEDGRRLIEASGLDLSEDKVVPYLFEEPLAPAVAERLEGRKIDLCFIKERIEDLSGTYNVVIVEGAGGLLVPITGVFTYADLAVLCRMPLIVVARSKLGTINHTLLTLRVASVYGLQVLAVVLNNYEGADTAEKTNPEVIREMGRVPVFTVAKDKRGPQELRDIAEVIVAYMERNHT